MPAISPSVIQPVDRRHECGAHTVPYIEAKNPTVQFEHEATTSKISDDQLFYCLQRGIPEEEAVALIVNGFVQRRDPGNCRWNLRSKHKN